jgi:hypothetical protein
LIRPCCAGRSLQQPLAQVKKHQFRFTFIASTPSGIVLFPL